MRDGCACRLFPAIGLKRPVSCQPLSPQHQAGSRDALTGYRTLRIALNPPRPELYHRINHRAAAMFERGLVEETALLLARFGPNTRALQSLGYAQAAAVLRNELTQPEAIAATQQGHRNFAKRQLTWFRRDPLLHWLPLFGDDPDALPQATTLIEQHLHLTDAAASQPHARFHRSAINSL